MKKFSVLILFLLLFSIPISSQERSKDFGLFIKMDRTSHFGLLYNISCSISIRPSLYFRISDSITESYVGRLCVLYNFKNSEPDNFYAGPNITYVSYEDLTFLGLILGKNIKLSEKVTVFGELGFDLEFNNGINSLSMLSTGIGLLYYLD